MASITTRSGKGSPLTNAEVDDNFTNLNTELGQKEVAANKGVANGYASLDSGGKVPSSQLPSYVDDVVEAADFAALPVTGETGKIYVTLDTNKTYRWSGSAYVEISATDFTGPATATDNAVTRFDGTTGKLVQNSGVTIDDSNNVSGVANFGFSGTGRRITGDFSSVPFNNRAAFQTSTANSATTVSAIPSGTGTSSQFVTHGGTDMGNTSRAGFNVNLSTNLATFFSDAAGTGTSLPMAFFTGGANRVWILTNGNVGIATGGTAASPLTIGGVVESTTGGFKFPDGTTQTTAGLSNSTTSTQSGYFGDIFLYDDSTPSHYLGITNSANLTAARTLSLNVNDADRTISLSGNLTVSSAATISGTNTGDQTITLTGDVTGSGTGSFAATLANSGVVAGSYGSASAIPVITVDAKGRLTSVSTSAVSIPSGSLTFTGDVTGSGTTGSSTALTLANSGVTAGTYTKVTVDAKGRVTTGASLASGDLPTYTGTITSSQVTTALGYTPYNSSNPSGYITSSALSSYLPLSGGTLSGTLSVSAGGSIDSSWTAGSASAWRFIFADTVNASGFGIGASGFGIFRNGLGDYHLKFATNGVVNAPLGLQQGGNQVLHAANYSSYSLPLSGGTLTGTVYVSTSGSGSNVRALRIGPAGGSPASFGNYSGGWRSTIEIWDNAATRMLHLTPPDGTNYNWSSIKSTDAGLRIDVGSGGGTNAIDIGTNGVANFPQGLQQGGNQVLHAGNYTSYSPSLGGSGASGTWGISISGSAAQLNGLSSTQLFNNMGVAHSGFGSGFDSVSNFGPFFIQGTGQGPGTGSSQFYGLALGLGNDYAYGSYALQLAIPRYNSSDKYLTMRTREGGTWGSWTKIHAGYADTAGSATDSTKLPLTGGTMTGDLRINSDWGAGTYNEQLIIYGQYPSMTFRSTNSDTGWLVHTQGDGGLTYYSIAGASTNNWTQRMTLLTNGELRAGGSSSGLYLHTGNFSSYALPLTGGTLTGDITTYRAASPTTGVIYFGNSGTRYLYYDGGSYNMPNANLYINGSIAVTAANIGSYASGGTPTLNVTSSTSFTAAASTHYVIVGGATTVTLPASPSAGTIVWITVANGRTDTVIARNGQNINSLAENMTVDSAFAGIQLRYADATRGWVFT